MGKTLKPDRNMKAGTGADFFGAEHHPAPLIRFAQQRCHFLHWNLFDGDGHTPVQIVTLRTLYYSGSLSKADLGSRILIKPTNLNGILNRLMERGLIEEKVDDLDARKRIVKLTDQGHREFEAALQSLDRLADELLSPLREAERPLFIDMLRRIAFGGDTVSSESLEFFVNLPE